MEQRYLRPNERCPVPLNEDFWKEIIGFSDSARQNADIAHKIDEKYASNVAAEVEKTIRENKENIDNAIIKQVS